MAFYIIVCIIILSFIKGVLELSGIPETFLQLSIDTLIILLSFVAFIRILKLKKTIFPALTIIILLLLTILLSFLVTDVTSLHLMLFIKRFGVYILFFYSLFNIKLSEKQKKKIVSLFIFMFIIQIPAAIIKLLVLGGTLEKIVGTMSVMEGSLATTMPLLAISYLIVFYLDSPKLKYIILILSFIGIGLVSNKLGILFYVMFLFIYLSYLFASPKFYFPNFKFFKKMTIMSIYLLIIFSLFVTLNPRANPEHKVGGSIDIEFLQNFVENYQTLDLDTGVEGDGRFEAPFVALKRLSDKGIVSLLFGFGPGDIVKSSLTAYENPLLEKYNIGYGGRLGVVWMLMQIGILGTVFFVLFHFYIFKRLYRMYQTKEYDKFSKNIILTVLGFSALFFIDFFTYSAEMMMSPGVTITYFFAVYYVFTLKKQSYFIKDNRKDLKK